MSARYDSGLYDADMWMRERPLEVGTRVKYYNHERMQELEAVVRSAGVYFLWVVDVKEPPENGSREHFIVYSDLTQVVTGGKDE